jgi:hypothetical protein
LYGDVICGISIICLVACTTISTTFTIFGIIEGSTLPLIILFSLTYVLSYSFFTLDLKALPSSTLFFLLKSLLGESTLTFFQFSNVVNISSLGIFTLVNGFGGFSF